MAASVTTASNGPGNYNGGRQGERERRRDFRVEKNTLKFFSPYSLVVVVLLVLEVWIKKFLELFSHCVLFCVRTCSLFFSSFFFFL